MNYPIAFLDAETTGTDPRTDRIVELCIIKLVSETERIVKRTLINPGIEIPKAASDIHGITDEMVKDAPTFKALSKSILEFINGVDIAGYNLISFDLPLLYEEFHRAGKSFDYKKVNVIDSCVIFKRKEERTLSAAVKFYTGKTHEDAHGAQPDVEGTIDVLAAQMLRYEDDLGKMDNKALALYSNYDKELVDMGGCFTKNEEGFLVVNFGAKHRGKLVSETPRSYFEWMMKENFMADTKSIVSKILYQGLK